MKVEEPIGERDERGDFRALPVSPVEQGELVPEPIVEEDVPQSILVRYGTQINEVGRLATVLIVGLVGFLFVIKPLVRAGGLSGSAKMAAPNALVEAQRPRTVADLESEIEAQIDAQTAEKVGENRKLPVLTRRVSDITKKEPEQVAKLLRGWMHEAER